MAQGVGWVVGPPAAGLLLDYVGFRATFVACALLCALATCACTLALAGDMLAHELGRVDEGVASLERAVGVLEAALGATHVEVAVARTTLADLLRSRRGECARALELYRLALGVLEAAPEHGPEHALTRDARVGAETCVAALAQVAPPSATA